MKHTDALKQPFFAQLLEEQKTPAPNQQFYPWTTKPTEEAQTQKYPSDGDDDNWPDPK
jgi:hypothetical protein